MRRRRVYAQRYPHPVGVYKAGWGPAWFVQVRVAGRLIYGGSYRDPCEAARVAAAMITQRDAARGVTDLRDAAGAR